MFKCKDTKRCLDDLNQINLAMWETCPENEWNFVGEFSAIKQKNANFFMRGEKQ